MALYIKHGDWPMVSSIWPFIKWIATAWVDLVLGWPPLYGSKLPLWLLDISSPMTCLGQESESFSLM